MIGVDIPGFGSLRVAHLVLDFNGTLAVDGKLLPGVKSRLTRLASDLRIHIITADTFGRARAALSGAPWTLTVLESGSQDRAKAAYVRRLGPARCACIGNGRNDRLMLRKATLGIAIVQAEGAATASILDADIVVNDVRDALDLLLEPARLIATLRA
ncbi:MAG: ATPase P [Betaproteobacteria bacterium RIFCSPLOWO2_02_FULL_62_17]|nr:MAG: ATPase P [Betaproteobacteria bacterium RIFCSPLOWO2_02_FULL_62_17]